MDLKELLLSLKRQEENLNILLTVSGNKQKAIIDGKIEKIEEAIFEEEKLFQNIGMQEKHRIELLQNYSLKLNLSIRHHNLSEFLAEIKPRLDPAFYGELTKARAEIVDLVHRINYINKQNKILITQSISFVKTTLTSLIDARKNSLIDRRM
jgi:flagellar biosynthesis/type III secretory pathway chaperone